MKRPAIDRPWMPTPRLHQLLGAVGVLIVAGLAVSLLRQWMPENVGLLVFLTAVLINSAAFGFWIGLLSAIGALATFNFFFVEPHYTFFAARPQDLVTLLAFLLAAGLTGFLAGRLREQVDAARGRADVLEVLSAATTDLAGAASAAEIVGLSARHISALSHGPVVVVRRSDEGLRAIVAAPPSFQAAAIDLQAAEQALNRGQVEFATAEGWTGSRMNFHPVPAARNAAHAFGHLPIGTEWRDHSYREQAITSVLQQAAAALDRLVLTQKAEEGRVARDRQALRAALLSSLSHDLRTPLATILGSVTTLRDLRHSLPPAAQEDLFNATEEEAQRLARYVEKLLQMTRLMTGVSGDFHWVAPADCAEAAVARARRAFPAAQIRVDLPDLPMVRAEAGLLEQVVFSLIENAVRYAPGLIEVSGAVQADAVSLSLRDHGPGLPSAVMVWLASDELTPGMESAGLGLPICKGIARTLDGALSARPAPGGGTEFHLSLPRPAQGEGA
ncbi:MAG TPA: DUF4118 domain-containing protein [Paenirhodobacter sp.]